MRLLAMIFAHIVADFNLQGIMASMKQKSWWQKQEGYSNKYRFDYIMVLLMHGLQWSFLIVCPFFFSATPLTLIIITLLNTIAHAYIDHIKANKLAINLIEDQCLHLIQIIITFLCLTYL